MITEAFKLINLPFFLGFVYLSYKLFRRHFNYKISLLGAVILLTMPIIEDTVFTASLYPDLIFAFLALYSFEILFENIDIVSKKRNLYFVFFGLLNITMMYLKYQALFIWLLNFIYILKARLNKQWIVTGVIFIPFLLRFVLDKKSDLLNIYNIFLFIITFCLTFFIQKNTNKKFYITKINILVILFLLIIGMFPIIRNYYLYGGFEDYTKHYNWINEIQIKSIIKLKTESTIFNHLFDIFINPKISLVYVIPMILGLITSFLDKKKHAITYIFLIYYFWWLIFLKGETIRWLLPIIPIITFYILVGLKYIFKQYKSIEKYILCSTIFLLLSSKMIIWTLASDYIGTQNIRKYYLGDMDSFSNIINPLNKSSFSNYIFNETVNFIYALSSRTEITKYQFKYLFLYIIFTFLFSTILIQKKYIRNKLLYIIPVVSVYCLFFIKIFHYNYVNSSDFIADKLFNYWGQSQFIVPYIRDNSTNNDVTLLFSDPTGMAYFTNSKVLNMYYGYGIGFFKGIFYQRNIQEIYEFYKKNNIKFVAILNYGVNTEKFKNLKKNTEIFDIIENNKYFKIVKFPDNDNYWYLYEII
jgi:glutaredoxin-related protein